MKIPTLSPAPYSYVQGFLDNYTRLLTSHFRDLQAIVAPIEPGGTLPLVYTIGDTLYASDTRKLSILPGNTVAVQKYLTQSGTGSASAAPVWTVFPTVLSASAVIAIGAVQIKDGSGNAVVEVSGTKLLSFYGATAVAQAAGYGTPTGVSKTANLPGTGATLAQVGGTLAALIVDLKALGLIAT